MSVKLLDSELKVMEVIWKEGDLPAKRVAEILGEQIGCTLYKNLIVIRR